MSRINLLLTPPAIRPYRPGMADLHKLIRRVERYIKARGITPTQFGRECKKNPALVPRLRSGKVTVATVTHVDEWLKEREAA